MHVVLIRDAWRMYYDTAVPGRDMTRHVLLSDLYNCKSLKDMIVWLLVDHAPSANCHSNTPRAHAPI